MDLMNDFQGLTDKVKNIVSAPGVDRLSRTPLLPGGGLQKKTTVSPNDIQLNSAPQSSIGAGKPSTKGTGSDKDPNADWRVRVSVANNKLFYQDTANAGVMAPLKQTNGVIFPYVPEVSIQVSARYGSTPLTHANYTSFFYEGSEAAAINISGEFTVQNREEGEYLLACIYFFRASTKMFYGSESADAGNPPPLLYLNGYGKHYLPNVPCVLTSFQHSMPADVDYIEVFTKNKSAASTKTDSGGSLKHGTDFTRLPTNSKISITLQPIYSRKRVTQFDLRKFAAGELLETGRGGFI